MVSENAELAAALAEIERLQREITILSDHLEEGRWPITTMGQIANALRSILTDGVWDHWRDTPPADTNGEGP